MQSTDVTEVSSFGAGTSDRLFGDAAAVLAVLRVF
jgi:hypothetical protein